MSSSDEVAPKQIEDPISQVGELIATLTVAEIEDEVPFAPIRTENQSAGFDGLRPHSQHANDNELIVHGLNQEHSGTSLQENAPEASIDPLQVRQLDYSQNLHHLDEQIANLEDAASLLLDTHSEKSSKLSMLGKCFSDRFERLGELSDISGAIVTQEEVVKLAHDDVAKAGHLNNLGCFYYARFQRLRERKDIDKVIIIQQQAVNLALDSHAIKTAYLNNLGHYFCSHFVHLREITDIDKSIAALQKALNLAPDGHTEKSLYLNHLGISFSYRFEHLGELRDIEEAILVQQEAITKIDEVISSTISPDSSFGKPRNLNTLNDIDKVIAAHQEAVDLTPGGHTHRVGYLSNLGLSFSSWFESLGDLMDINKVNNLQEQAVSMISDGHIDKSRYLKNLAMSFYLRFEHLGELIDIDKAIAAGQEALKEITDIDKAIAAQQKAVTLTPDGHAAKPGYLNNLGISFKIQFEHFGEHTDIDKAIAAQQEAVDLIPDDHTAKASMLNSLGVSFSSRFGWSGKLTDIDKAIASGQEAVNLTPIGHALKANYLNSLGSFFEAVDLTPDNHVAKPKYLANLGISYCSRFNHLGELIDIDNTIAAWQKAVNITPDNHPGKHEYLHNLGNSFLSRAYESADVSDIDEAIIAHQNAPTDIDKAIDTHQQAVNLIPDGHTIMAQCLGHLGIVLESQLKQSHKVEDLERCLNAYYGAANNKSTQYWASLALTFQIIPLALEAYKVLLEMIPQRVWIGQKVTHRYQELSDIGSVINAAAAMAITSGNLTLALEWLEEGRSIVWGQILQLHTPVDELHLKYPEYAEQLSKVSGALVNAGISRNTQNVQEGDLQGYQLTIEEEAQTHCALATEYSQLIEQIHTLEGFNDFLQPKKLSELVHVAKNGPVVVINVHESHCDALVLHSYDSSEPIIHVPLPQFSQEKAEELFLQMNLLLKIHNVHDARKLVQDKDSMPNSNPSLQDILHKLWVWIVEPIILATQHVLEDIAGDYINHITWCATGLLALLPLHAAGEYDLGDSSKKNVFDIVVSSYTPTLTTLLPHLEKQVEPSNNSNGILVISQPNTPGQQSIRGTINEAEAIKNIFRPIPAWNILHLNDEKATVKNVSEEMGKNQWIHLACHGIQDVKDAVKSAFALHDGKLHLETLMSTSLENAQFAFLSACQTATGDEKLPDEAVHLAAGMPAFQVL
ncbi:hypothetical protein M422DRAFT_249807 [Sphaerobolus stellatus SS14]|uniref:CHAT domain-containing protein n=1 Tax=Sphaerobolus stellatus (strain SS14) TaxID=990650 RepID=A0A0C9UUD5_SPHS4|nr:hypothetical protein M422DRAFT_249807 [Sphaerobolus stellatus SS14]